MMLMTVLTIHMSAMRHFVMARRHIVITVPHNVRCEVGICRRRVPPRHHLDHLHHLMRQRNLRKANLPRDATHHALMLGEDGGVLEHHGHAAYASVIHRLQLRGQRGGVWGPTNHDALTSDALLVWLLVDGGAWVATRTPVVEACVGVWVVLAKPQCGRARD